MSEHAAVQTPNERYFDLRRYTTLAIWLMVVVTIVLIPLRIVGWGYLPSDDALRHAAKAITNRPWSEILVLRPDATLDSHAAWHALLRGLHLATACGADTLVVAAVVGLAILFLSSPLRWFRAPEAWLASWLLVFVAHVSPLMRITRGRPYIISMATLLVLVQLWTRGARHGSRNARLVYSTLLFMLAAWLHGSWYLLFLIPLAFAAARRLRPAVELTGCWVAGCLFAALLTGQPWNFLAGQVSHMLHAMGDTPFTPLLVSEFQPSGGGGFLVLIWFLLVAAWLAHSRQYDRLVRDPIFMLALLGWLLGLKVVRFWEDWGLPCAALWMACRLEPLLLRLGRRAPMHRLAVTVGTCLAILLLSGSDLNGRWTNCLRKDYLSQEHADLQPWLPSPGGILYTSEMKVFYDTFYTNPHAEWRYVVGFEPTLMPPDDLTTFNNILWNAGDRRAYQPWIDKMQAADRLIVLKPAGAPPRLPALEWHYAASDTWIGRLRPTASDPADPDDDKPADMSP